jgi:hypothetical protein
MVGLRKHANSCGKSTSEVIRDLVRSVVDKPTSVTYAQVRAADPDAVAQAFEQFGKVLTEAAIAYVEYVTAWLEPQVQALREVCKLMQATVPEEPK